MDILDPLKQNAYTTTCNSSRQYQDQQRQQQTEHEQQYPDLMTITNFQDKPLQATDTFVNSEPHNEQSEYQSIESSSAQQQNQQCNLETLDAHNNEEDTNLNSTIQDEVNDDDSFVALCTDASSVLNNDPSRRYYINKLYQPMNGHQEDTQLIEHDDEYLLYQELRFLESTAQELTDGRQRVQLTKILEDDEGEDDDDVVTSHMNDSGCRQRDELGQLRLTTIIEGFESFPSSPLIDGCSDRDPLMSEACESHDEQLHNKPDSTRQGVISPTSSNSSGCEVSGSVTSNSYSTTSMDHFQPHQHNQQFESDQDEHLHLNLSHTEDVQNSHFLSTNTNNVLNHESQHSHNSQLQHQHLQQHDIQFNEHFDSQQVTHDSSSEISCFQQVSSTLESLEESNKSYPDLPSCVYSEHYDQDDEHHSISYQKSVQDGHSGCNTTSGRTKKRSRQQSDDSINEQLSSDDKIKRPKSRIKRKRIAHEKVSKFSFTDDKAMGSPTISSMASSMINSSLEQNPRSNQSSGTFNSKTDNEYQHEHITTDDDHLLNDDLDGLSMDDEDSQCESLKNPHMSKYRRRTANARERIRMREINQAFEKLKKVVPIELIQQSASGDESDQTSFSNRKGNGSRSGASQQGSNSTQPIKLTKITTLRLAVSYIAKLSEVLSQHPEGNSGNVLRLSSSSSGSTGGENEVRCAGGIVKGKQRNALDSGKKTRRKRIKSSGCKLLNTKTRLPAKDAVAVAKQNSNNDFLNQKMSVDNGNTLTCASSDRQQRISQPVIVANNVLQSSVQQIPNGFIQVQQQHQLQHPKQQQQQLSISQQPLTISQGATSDRAFVTPVAVAILGIPSGNNQCSAEPQTLQLLGIQNAQQLQAQRTQQHIQVASPYNLVNQQPQQVTLTLDEVNGLSVLRLTNPQTGSSQQRTIQLQEGQRVVQQSQLFTTAQGYNYATYQPLHVQSNGLTARPTMFQQAAIQFCSPADVQNTTSNSKEVGIVSTNQHTQNISNSENSNSGAMISLATSTPTNTGTHSDYRAISLPPNTIVQHLSSSNGNNNNSTIVQSAQFKIQQSNCASNQFLTTNHLIAVSPSSTQITGSRASNIGSSSVQTQANLFYINPPVGMTPLLNNTDRNRDQKDGSQQAPPLDQSAQQISSGFQRFELSSKHKSNRSVVNEKLSRNDNNQIVTGASFEQMKFIAQFNTQPENRPQNQPCNSNEANIRELVASIATSIHPNGDKSNTTHQEDGSDSKRQPKRTYRFHNYDGNMITNHLYSSNQDKQNQQKQQQTPPKRSDSQFHSEQAINQASCQRSRQNSLSSTCSTTSSSSSLMTSMSTASPNLPLVPILIKSPTPEKGIRSATS